MREVRMEVVSLEEALQYCTVNNLTFIKCYQGKQANLGKLMMLAIDEYPQGQLTIEGMGDAVAKPKEEKNTVIFCNHSDSKMFVTRKTSMNRYGVTFDITQAQSLLGLRQKPKHLVCVSMEDTTGHLGHYNYITTIMMNRGEMGWIK